MQMMTADAVDRWQGGACPFDAGWRKVMMWWFIITDGLLFAGFLASYGYGRLLSSGWPDQTAVFSLPYIAAMTFVLVTSSATMATAVDASRTGRMPTAGLYLLLTAGGGILFLGMQALEWRSVIEAGGRLNGNPWGDAAFGSYFFLLTGFHGSHVLTGILVLLTVAVRVRLGRATPAGIEMAGLYWHFVDLVWVFIFAFFYLW
jgi:cytochrome c oxidase subunit 3